VISTRLEIFRDGEVIARPSKGPRIVVLELTTRCNLNCSMCFRRSWSERIGDMDERVFSKALDEAIEAGVRFVWFAGWGEPTIHPKFIEWAETVKDAGLGLGVNTNGTLLDDELAKRIVEIGIDRLSVSVDAASEETYARIRGHSLRRVLKALRIIHEAKKERGCTKPILEFVFTAQRSNVAEFPKLFDLAVEAGVGRIIVSNIIPTQPALEHEVLYNGWSGEERLRELASIRSLETNVGVRLPEFSIKTERSCAFVKEGATCVTWDGKVTPCYNFLHTYTAYVFGVKKTITQVSFGDLRRENLVSIWRKPDYVRFRYRVHFFRYPSCADCKLREYCILVESVDMDCWGNSPTCADCLYGRGIVQCPL